jgi:hypothetical protein
VGLAPQTPRAARLAGASAPRDGASTRLFLDQAKAIPERSTAVRELTPIAFVPTFVLSTGGNGTFQRGMQVGDDEVSEPDSNVRPL